MAGHGDESPEVLSSSAYNSSPSSAEASFREMDDVFLQTQTRIWLGEVLQTRLSDQLSIADLLADGELLYELSREIWKMMLAKHVELNCINTDEYEPFASRSIGRYTPYSNVDSFLKICKIMGLAGIDLFSPSDVVEKRNTRKVCMCIRALSKKARSRNFNVADFDIVMYTAPMPTYMVGNIRRSWEISRGDYYDTSITPHHELIQRSMQKHSGTVSGPYQLYFQESSDVDSDTISYNSSSGMSSDLTINCTEVLSAVKNEFSDQCSVKLDVQTQLGDEVLQHQQAVICLNKFTGSLFSHHLNYDHQLDNISSPSFVDSNIQLGGKGFNAESDANNCYKSTVLDQIYNNTITEDGVSVVGDSMECVTPESNIIGDQSAMSAIIGCETDAGESILLDGKEYILCARDTSYCCSKAIRNLENEFKSQYIDGDVGELSSADSASLVPSIANVSSVSVALQNLDFDHHSDTEGVFKNDWVSESANSQLGGLSKKQTEESELPNLAKYETLGQMLSTSKKEESLFDIEGMDISFSSTKENGYLHLAISYDNSIYLSQINPNVVDDESKGLFTHQYCFPMGAPMWDQKGKCGFAMVPIEKGRHGASSLSISPIDSQEENLQFSKKVTEDALWFKNNESIVADDKAVHSINTVKSDSDTCKQPNKSLPVACSNNLTHNAREDSSDSCNVVKSENVNQDEGEKEKLQMSAVENSNTSDSPEIEAYKTQKQPLFKSVVKGSAVLGALFVFLHFRKNGREKSGRSEKQSNQIRNTNGEDCSSAKGQSRKIVDGVYPSEKLKLVH